LVRLLAALLLAVTAAAGAAEPDWHGVVLRTCETTGGYPPFAFPADDGHAQGFSVDLLNEAIAGTDLRIDVAFLPNRRCDNDIDQGRMDLSMEETWDPDVASRWLPTDAIYEVTMVMFYDRLRHPEGLTADAIRAQPQKYHGCGILGFTYQDFPPGQVDDRSYKYADAFGRMLQGGCDFVPDYLEFGAAYRLRGKPLFADPRVAWARYPLLNRPAIPTKYPFGDKAPFFFYLRPGFPHARELIGRINDTIASWRRTGHDREVLGRYIDPAFIGGKP
jgi:hypothetical protein